MDSLIDDETRKRVRKYNDLHDELLENYSMEHGQAHETALALILAEAIEGLAGALEGSGSARG